jgi:feruloyl esterase
MIKRATLGAIGLAALAVGSMSHGQNPAPPAGVMAGADRCAQVTPAMLGAASATGKWVEAANGLPAFCEVTGTLSPVSGSTIGVVYRLPASWNGKVLGFGGGGWIGNIALPTAADGLRKGYATMQTDAGHPITNVWDNSWAADPVKAADFSYRGIHEMTEAGKRLAAAYYGQPHRRAYYQGCSTGGRMGLMEAQRYPADFDMISAGAPVYTLQTQTSAVLRNQTFSKPGAAFTAADLQLAQTAALNACDANDGLKDGLINNPGQCRWDPAQIQCSGAKTDSCLAPAQVTALRTAYNGIRSPDGQWAMLPLNRGGEAGWAAFVGTNGTGADATNGGGLGGLLPIIFGNRPVTLAGLTLQDVQEVRRCPFAQMYEAKDPTRNAFFGRGGKLLLWHGLSDPGPSPVATTDYVQAVMAQAPAAANNMRYFLYPGVGHCAGGPGADQVALLDALEAWDTSGQAPNVLIGRKGNNNPLVRPHCAWPNVARYRGTGDANDPASWQCTVSGPVAGVGERG